MNQQPETLQGSYRLHVAPTLVTITKESITIKLKKIYKFNRESQLNDPKYIKLATPPNTNLQIAEQDKQLVQLFQSIQEYECNGGMMRMYGSGHNMFIRAWRQNQSVQDKENIQGEWKMQLVNLALQVSELRFQFQGINNVRYLLSYRASKDGNIEFELQTEQEQTENKKQKNAATIDFDVIFINALLRSTKFKLGQVSFELFGEDGELTARGTPYM